MEMQRDRFFSAGCGGDLSVNVLPKISAGFLEFARWPRPRQKQEFKLCSADFFAFFKSRDIQLRFQQFLERARRLGRVHMDLVRRPCVRSSESKRRRQTGINEEFAANAQTLLRRSCRMICQAKLRKKGNRMYQSDITQFIHQLKRQKPWLEAAQRNGRALLWDKPPIDLEERARERESRAPQMPYVY